MTQKIIGRHRLAITSLDQQQKKLKKTNQRQKKNYLFYASSRVGGGIDGLLVKLSFYTVYKIDWPQVECTHTLLPYVDVVAQHGGVQKRACT